MPQGVVRDRCSGSRLRMWRRWATMAVVGLLGSTTLGLGAGSVAGATSHGAAAAMPRWLAAKDAALEHFQPPPPASVTLAPPQAGPGYRTQTFSATVHVGPGRATTCPVVGELLVPDGASRHHPVPAVMTTNGFGGAYDDSSTLGIAEQAATDGFVGLSYSGLGFGGSGCQIDLDVPGTDGVAASELLSWLGTQPEVLQGALPATDPSAGDDPVVGMIGGSYGGEITFATASVDPRLDAIVPVITWNDLAYSLAPNNDTTGEPTDAVPGVLKWQRASLFFADGLITPLEERQLDRVGDCPGFAPAICQAYVTSVALGYPDPATVALLRSDSMVSYWRRVHLPVLLAQGEDDSLFNIQEAVDNLHELQANGDPTTLVLQSWGHSDSTPAPGELSYTAPFDGYENVLIQRFFDRWLVPGDQQVSTGAAVEYFRPWVHYPGDDAAAAYGTAPSWPVGHVDTLYLSGGTPLGALATSLHDLLASVGAAGGNGLSTPGPLVVALGSGGLVGSPSQVRPGTEAMVNLPGGVGTSYSETSGVQDSAPFSDLPAVDLPGTAMSWTSAPLPAPLDVVGVPTLHVQVRSLVPGGLNPSTDPVVFAKLYDQAPDGRTTLVDRLVAPVRIGDPNRPVTITLPGIVHQYAAGDRLQLVLAAGDLAYLGNRAPDLLTVTVGPGHPGVFSLPVVPPDQQRLGGPVVGPLGPSPKTP